MEEVGSTVKREYCHEENDEELRKAVHDACYEKGIRYCCIRKQK